VGDFLLVNKQVYAADVSVFDRFLLPRRNLRRGDIVVFKYPNDMSKDYVKRVVGLPGETFEIRDKQVLINDKPIEEKYKVHSDAQVYVKRDSYNYEESIRDNYPPVTIPPGHIFAMGDNRDNSSDSRYWGFLPLSYVKGRPWVIYFSYKADRDAYQRTSVRERLKKLVSFIPKARWGRMLKLIR
jgi:signal peptidase I